jgi:FtsH-binding integral membrane protein
VVDRAWLVIGLHQLKWWKNITRMSPLIINSFMKHQNMKTLSLWELQLAETHGTAFVWVPVVLWDRLCPFSVLSRALWSVGCCLISMLKWAVRPRAVRKYSYPLTYSTFCCVTAWIQNVLHLLFVSPIYTQHPIMEKWKHVVGNLLKMKYDSFT